MPIRDKMQIVAIGPKGLGRSPLERQRRDQTAEGRYSRPKAVRSDQRERLTIHRVIETLVVGFQGLTSYHR
jgi:hypothetical protein